MARNKKDGRRATGVQARKGNLYYVIPVKVIRDGKKTYSKEWIATGLKDTPENVPKVAAERERILRSNRSSNIDRNILIPDFVNLFMDKKRREVSDTTYAAYLCRAKNVKDYFYDTKLRTIKESTVGAFLDSLFTQNNMTPRTVRDIRAFLAGVIDYALQEGLVTCNPVKNTKVNKQLAREHANQVATDEVFFSRDEASLFLSRLKGEHDKAKNNEREYNILYPMFYLTIYFGLRREEVLGLRWSAIDFNNKTLKINHTVTKGTTVNRLNATKTEASERLYPLTDNQINLLLELKSILAKQKRLFGNTYIENDYLFKNRDGKPFYPDYPSKIFKKLLKTMPDLPQHVSFHGLRKTCISMLVHAGTDIKSIQNWVGHKDQETTLGIYAKVKDQTSKGEISDTMTNLLDI